MMTRCEFLVCSAAGGVAALSGCASFGGGGERVPYGETIGDRLWMWGHHRDSFKALKGTKEQYNLPYETRIDMADACRRMDVPGCFVVRWTNRPTKAELPTYMRQFAQTKRVGFSITDSAVESFDEKVRLGLDLADRLPNLTTLVMDDFFMSRENRRSLDDIRRVRTETERRGLKLGIVLYADANGVKREYAPVLDLFDEITFWFWCGKNVGDIEGRVADLRRLVGAERPVLLGQYMWDFGGAKPMSGHDMARQLEQTSRLLARGEIAGVIFHCTPLVDMELDAVRVAREWIRENKERKWGQMA